MPVGFWLAVASFAGLALAVLLAVYGCVAAFEARADEDAGRGRVLGWIFVAALHATAAVGALYYLAFVVRPFA